MKRIYIGLSSLFMTLLVGCNGNEWEQPTEFSKLAFVSEFAGSPTREAAVDKFKSYSDLSSGAISRTWTIPKGAFFLKGPIPNNLPNHDEFIINAGDTVSSEKTIHVLFQKGNSNTIIKLRNEFKDSTNFVVPNDDGDVDTIFTVKTNKNTWVAEHQFTLDVYDTVVANSIIKLEKDLTTVDYNSTDVIEIEFDEKLNVEDWSSQVFENNARPDFGKWTVLQDADNAKGEKVIAIGKEVNYSPLAEGEGIPDEAKHTITFGHSLGDFKLRHLARRSATETLKANDNTLDIPLIIRVVPKKTPLSLMGKIKELANDQIAVTLDTKLKEFTEDVSSGFILNIDGVPTDIKSVELDEENSKRLLISLNDILVPSDAGKLVTLSYDGSFSSLISLDNRQLESFTNESIEVNVPVVSNLIIDSVESDSELITLLFDQGFTTESLGATPKDGFVVKVGGVTFEIGSIKVNDSNPMALEITMSESIYNSDIITVSYDGLTGTVLNEGKGPIETFTDLSVKVNTTQNILPNAGFEDGGLGADSWYAGVPEPAGLVNSATVEISSDQVNSGANSLKVMMSDGQRGRFKSPGVTLEAGTTYNVSYKYYVTSGALFTGMKTWMALDEKLPTRAALPNVLISTYDTWVEVNRQFEASASDTRAIFIQVNPGNGTIYYDDFNVSVANNRP